MNGELLQTAQLTTCEFRRTTSNSGTIRADIQYAVRRALKSSRILLHFQTSRPRTVLVPCSFPDAFDPQSAVCIHDWMFDVRLTFSGRVAESGLRHSTRNRAWGNPPWVRIPPLPPPQKKHRTAK